MIHVRLSEQELRDGAAVGIERVLDSINRKPRFTYGPGMIWRGHIMGALAEAVIVHHTGWLWNHEPGVFKSKPDVGAVDVRWSGQNPPKLKVRPDDVFPLVLVSGDVVDGFIIHGWLPVEEAKALGHWTDRPPPCWFVDIEHLRDFTEITDNPLPGTKRQPPPPPPPFQYELQQRKIEWVDPWECEG